MLSPKVSTQLANALWRKRGRLANARSKPCLLIIHGGSLGKKFTLEKPEMIIGRGDPVDIRLNEEQVSRQHAKISFDGHDTEIEDLTSANGTYVNTKRLKNAKLRHGDLLLIGRTILKFISGDNVENAYHEEIYRLATMDGLTQIYNKKYFMERLQGEFGRSRRYKRDLALVLFDLDHFKQTNDIHGHPAGDYVLKRVANLISDNLRKEDIFGRYGGEEFSIILPETDSERSSIIGEKLRKLVEESIFRFNNIQIPVTISMGISSFHAERNNITTAEALIEQSDQALYYIKKNGRNGVAHFFNLPS